MPHELGPLLDGLVESSPLRLKMISNRGTKVYPDGNSNIDVVDHYRCRFVLREDGELTRAGIRDLLSTIEGDVDWVHLELLQEFDGAAAYTKAQGED